MSMVVPKVNKLQRQKVAIVYGHEDILDGTG
jgi:hypothetical protein